MAQMGETYQDWTQIASPGSPASTIRRVYVDSTDGKLKILRSDGTIVQAEQIVVENSGDVLFLKQASVAPSTDATGVRVYAISDGGVYKLFYRSSDGTIVGPLAGAGAAGDHNHTSGDGSGVLTNDEHDGHSEIAEIAAPSTPAVNKLRLYAKDKSGVSNLYFKDDAGVEHDLGAAGGSINSGTATIDFGAFPGAYDTSVAVTGQAAIASGSILEAWIRPVATADHSADEHMIEPMNVVAGNIVAGTGFTIYAFASSELHEPGLSPQHLGNSQGGKDRPRTYSEGVAPRIYGAWTVAWQWA